MKGIFNLLGRYSGYKHILKGIEEKSYPLGISGISGPQKAFVTYDLYNYTGKPFIIVSSNESEAKNIVEDLSCFIPEKVMYFPPKEIVLYDLDAMSRDITEKRLKVLEKLIHKQDVLVVTTFDALMQKLPSANAFGKAIFLLSVNMQISMQEMILQFITAGYERVDIVDAKGQFAVRGGILDFFPYEQSLAVRIELFGDTIDSIRNFDISTQRSVEMINEVEVFPVRESIINIKEIPNVIEAIEKEYNNYSKIIKAQPDRLNKLGETINSDIEKIKENKSLENIDRYFDYFNEEWNTLLDYCQPESIIILDEPQKSYIKGETVFKEFSEIFKAMLEKGSILPSSLNVLVNHNDIFHRLHKENLISLSSFPAKEVMDYKQLMDLKGREFPIWLSFEKLFEELASLIKNDYTVILFAGSKSGAQRINQELRNRDLESLYYESLEDLAFNHNGVFVTHGSLSASFEFPELKFAVISDKRLFGEDKKAKKPLLRKSIIEFTDLNPGDYVVHQTHGVGKYLGIDKLEVEGITRDYLKISYQNNDMLYIPSTQLEVLQKYIGSEGRAPKLNKFGGADWAKTKKKVKESLMILAEGLIALYAERQANKGHAFSQDTVWQKQFEENFPYQETEDQIKSIEEVKEDMESDKVMDRLLCGDVGVGKTEVAIRAAFKAAIEGKQVAYLVPTTILAQQQYNTFAQRMRDFPIKVEMLSRFRTQAQQKKIIKDIKNGIIDIIIGTHRIIQKDMQFKDLGLLIIDEEQRFGVAHKEKIKALKSNVDVLTLTATPIPRTLHMALTGIRDMSAIYEPPEDRHPVQTFVMEYDHEIIKEAIIREINRNGQVFYLSNRVNSIERVAAEVKGMVPYAKVVTAHGQMEERELEDIMMGFIEGKWNVLVCTTIIESGLDIPNVNTIIIEDSDKMGLAQLYQLRGRVGRANRLAHAYLTYRKDKVLTEDAEKRLKAIKDFTEFGSGFKIAMRDLEIRGAGNLIGPEQHGHIEAVGYDTYCRLLEAAVKELKGEDIKEEANTQIELNVSAYIKDDYIVNESQKIEMYKKIASARMEEDIRDIEDELIDRYGDIPPYVYNLLEIAYIKILARNLKITSISDRAGSIIFQFEENGIKFDAVAQLVNIYKRKILFTASNPPYITYKLDLKNENKVKNIKSILQDLKKLQEA
ncbi:MAG: transcription-repair coupling factor [Deltaproteobacteria bacterium]